jgi:short subunit dehydrogenase-like uncharacterized protein
VSEADLDVVVFGATGVTGRRVAAYLADRASETGAGWAAAGRDAAKVERILAEDGVSAPETIVADIGDDESLAKMASRAKVVLNLVGPYTLYGAPVIKACVENGASYADLTGEIPFVRQMIDRFDSSAREAGVKLIQVCGFEALPPDLAVLSAAETARERFGEELVSADLEVSVKGPPGLPRPTDMISGGTAQSVAEIAGSEDPSLVTDPAALITDPAAAEEVRRNSPISLTPRRGERGAVIAPMAPAAFINPAVIQRTAALASDGKGSLRYREGIAMPGGSATLPLRYTAAGMLAGTQAVLGSVTKAGPAVRRRVAGGLRRVLPSSGFGPDADRLEIWSWRMSVVGRTGSGKQVRTAVDAEGHPGYLATARMLGEAGLLLAEEGATPDRAGCLTPAIGLGTDCLPRFDAAKVRFSVEPA